MGLIYLSNDYRAKEETAVCLGTFDGVHLGHQALLRKTAEIAPLKGLVPAAFTFDRPPYVFFHPEHEDEILSTVEEKAGYMISLGIRDVICCPFTAAVCGMSYTDFFDTILLKQCRAREIVIGFHFTFGRNAEGTAETIRPLCERKGIGLTVIPPVKTSEGQLISSTVIRQYIRQGDPVSAEKMLGHSIDLSQYTI